MLKASHNQLKLIAKNSLFLLIFTGFVQFEFLYSYNEENCLECHEKEVEIISNSIHSDEACSSCHGVIYSTDDEENPHPEGVPQMMCSRECHEETILEYKKGSHAMESTLLTGKEKTCYDCHGSHEIIEALDSKSKITVEIKKNLSRSVHADLECEDCHETFESSKNRPMPVCDSCHDEVAEVYANSVHGNAEEDRDMALCYDCHGSHLILRSDNIESKVFRTTLPVTCAKCHAKKEITKFHGIDQPEAVALFEDSMHGRALFTLGLKDAPSCNDCHGVHDIQNHNHRQSPIHHNNIPVTCGKCHEGIQQTFDQSIHGILLTEGDPEVPVCTTCHSAHDIDVTKNVIEFKRKSDDICGNCHFDRLEKYRETYHGKSIALGYSKVAACFDCHGKHDIFASIDWRSKLFRGVTPRGKEKNKRLETCRECHSEANNSFTDYYSHADHTDKKNYPVLYYTFIFMTFLTIGVFGFFGVHSGMWFFRTMHFLIKDPKKFMEERRLIKEDKEIFVRFKPIDRFIHALIIISFLALVLTGMPLKFYEAEWAKYLFAIMGGSESAGSIHRGAAIITIFYFILHVLTMIFRLFDGLRKKNRHGKSIFKAFTDIMFGPDSPIPHKRDIEDFVAHQKYFFGKGPRPQFDFWTYWEKFDYWAVFWGVFMIGVSGLVMWFPEYSSQYLPGWAINVALVIHSDEALLAAGFIFTFHFFNVHLRPEKFPIDSVIFSGRITKAELEHERGRYLKRMQDENRMEEIRHKDEWESWKKVVHPLGYMAFSIGILLVILIYWAMSQRIFG
ncbi:MAG: hypothetical protein OEZ13_12050 [Spirochaetia bacterium]|nr:hypothetical protein [Spirochaetia bacterium]